MAEIRSKSLAKGYDPEQVLDSVMTSPFEGETTMGTNSYSFTPDRLDQIKRKQYPEFSRICPEIVLRSINVSDNRAPQVFEFGFPLVGPFARLPNDFVSLLFSMALGYIISTSLLFVKLLKGTSVSCSYIIFKPLAGGLASCVLFLCGLSGGKVLIEGSATISSAGVGVLAIIGALWCERFDKLLKNAVSNAKIKTPKGK